MATYVEKRTKTTPAFCFDLSRQRQHDHMLGIVSLG